MAYFRGAMIELHRVWSIPLPAGGEVVALLLREPAGWSGPGRWYWRDGGHWQLGLQLMGRRWGLQVSASSAP